jgi:thioesterase domain-containing protein
MIPATFVTLDALPLSPNRKVDRDRLPVPVMAVAGNGAAADAAPRDALEQQLVAIWERVLGVRGIGALDNFFDLGGHSLLAVRLYAEIQKIAGRTLPLALLFQAPTLRQFAEALRQQVWSESWSPLVALQREGDKAPLFLVHAIGGNVLNYRDLAFHLRGERPVYALQAVGLDGRQAPNTRVEEIAARYIREIRAVHTHGLLHLGGSSFGGVIAFEMARQLREQGEQTGLIILLEAYPSARDCADFVAPGLRTSLRSLKHRVEFHARNLWTLPARDKMRYFASKAHIAGARLHHTIAGNPNGDANGNFTTALRQVKRANKHAFAAYRPRVYPGSVTLFRTADSAPAAQSDPTLGWARYVTGDVTVFEVPGDHRNMIMEPHVRTLVSQLQNCFNLAEATGGNGKITHVAGAPHANGH